MRVLFGRDAESAAVAGFLAESAPSLLVIEGAPGIGKTALFRAAVEAASGHRVVVARPIEAEMDLPFTGLGDLLAGDAIDLAGLPEPQRLAIEAALLLRSPSGAMPNPRAVGVALLNLLRGLAVSGPLVVAVDDAHWLDRASSSALGFAVRRLDAEPIRVVLARRSGATTEVEARVDYEPARVSLGPLTLGAIHALLLDRTGVVLKRPVLRQVLEWSKGNPLHALELARAFMAGQVRVDVAHPSPIGLERLVAQRIEGLPNDSRIGLAVVAASSAPTTRQVAAVLGVDDPGPALAPAVGGGVVEVTDGRIGFTHPLLASAAYTLVEPSALRALHGRLAEVSDDPDERARHLAHAADGPDPRVAAALEAAAERVFRRGAPSLASGLAELARNLTPPEDVAELHRRTLAEAEYRFEAGDTPNASNLVAELAAEAAPGPDRAALWALQARFEHFGHGLGEAVALLRRARDEAGDDPLLRLRIQEGLAWQLYLIRHDLAGADEAATDAVRLAEALGDPVALGEALAIAALTGAARGSADPALIRRAIDLEPGMMDLRVLRHPSFAHACLLTSLDRFTEATGVFEDLLARAEASGDESALPTLLQHLGLVRCLTGDLPGALADTEEAAAVAAQDDQVPAQASALGRIGFIEARRGDPDRAEAMAGRALALAAPNGFDPSDPAPSMARGSEMAIWTLGLTALHRADPARAATLLAPMAEVFRRAGYRQPGELRLLPDTVDALAAAGATDDAASLVAWMATMPAEQASAAAALAMARGVLAGHRGDLSASAAHLEEAVAAYRSVPLPFEVGRALLALGKVQRRARSKAVARQTLEAAAATFEEIGSHGWVRLAVDEAARVGRGGRAANGHTPTELRIAELVAAGHTNREVARRLYVSTKTVEATLTRLYAKLGIRSRTELVRWVMDRAPTD